MAPGRYLKHSGVRNHFVKWFMKLIHNNIEKNIIKNKNRREVENNADYNLSLVSQISNCVLSEEISLRFLKVCHL